MPLCACHAQSSSGAPPVPPKHAGVGSFKIAANAARGKFKNYAMRATTLYFYNFLKLPVHSQS